MHDRGRGRPDVRIDHRRRSEELARALAGARPYDITGARNRRPLGYCYKPDGFSAWPCHNCAEPRYMWLEIKDERGHLWATMPCERCEPERYQVERALQETILRSSASKEIPVQS